MDKRNFFQTLSGILLICLGLIVISGWYFHIPVFISILPGHINMVFNTALCFALSGFALVLLQLIPNYQNSIYTFFGTLIFLISGLTLLQYVLHQSFGIDNLFLTTWLSDQNIFPGRMAINASIGFTLTALCFLLLPFSYKQIIAVLVQVMIFSIFLLSASALIGYLLQLEFPYSWHRYTKMAIHTSVGMTLLSAALWATWSNSNNYLNLYKEHEDRKIILLSAMILVGITGIACLFGYTVANDPDGDQIELIFLILGTAICVGVLLLDWQVLPLAIRLVNTKKEAIENNTKLQAIFNHISEGIITTNSEGIIESFNPAAAKMFGYEPEEVYGKNIEILIPLHLREKYHLIISQYLQTHDLGIMNNGNLIVPGIRKDQTQFYMELSITKMRIGDKYKLVGMLHDISERKAAEEKILESETRFRLAFDYSPVGMALVSLDGRWLKVNKVLCDLVGYSESEMLQMDFQTMTHADDLEADLKYIKQLYDGEISFYRMEKRYIRKDNTITWLLLTGSIIRNEKGIPLYYIGQFQDINDKKKAEDELSFKAYYDTLTGLINRNQLEHSLDLSISSALRNQQRFAVFFMDLDHFKNINDTLGHNAGDELLKIVGDRLRNGIRKTDIAARLGGDEFILVLNGTDNPDTAAIFAEKILNTILKPIIINEHQLYITASIGISFYPSDGTDYQSLIKSADLALYKAKDKGRNNYQFCTPEMNEEIQEKIMYKQALQSAIENQELYLTYLPKIDTQNHIIGFEALLRWSNQKYGDVSPVKIIPLAEEIGIISQLGNWVIRTAAQQTLLWDKSNESPLKVTINISTRHYLQADFVNTILQILNEINFPPYHIELEINESLIMQDPDYSMKIINNLKQYGIQIIIDNFGTGYSSLNFLNQFKVDYVKISREFIRNIVTNFQHHELVTAMIALAKNLNIKVIAEGIESEEQYLLLLQMGCDQFQGYYFSQPLLAEKIPQLLAEYELKTESI